MKTCKDCKHWGPKTSTFSDRLIERFKYCNSEKITEDGPQPGGRTTDMLIYDYYEGGGFSTGPDFGCVHWSKREPN